VSPSLRILIVEDHEDLADALRANLRSEGYQASVASDGRQALAMVRADPPDIVVLDLGIPGLDGLALLSRCAPRGTGAPSSSCRARLRLGQGRGVPPRRGRLRHEAVSHGGADGARGRDGAARRSGAGRGVGPAGAGPRRSRAPDTSLLTPQQIMGACGLTLRQAEVALLIAEGRSNPEIAERLGISRFTARNHAEQILARLKVESRWQVARALCDVVAAARRSGVEPFGTRNVR
jgi:DNA-binding NarL/FixJ family response regulator